MPRLIKNLFEGAKICALSDNQYYMQYMQNMQKFTFSLLGLCVAGCTFITAPARGQAVGQDEVDKHLKAQIMQAVQKFQGGDKEGAFALLNQILTVDPANLNALNAQAGFMQASGDLKGALGSLDKLIELYPENPKLLFNRGRVYTALNDLPNALKDYDRSIKADPDFAMAYSNRGMTRGDLGQLDDGIKDLQRASELAPNLPDAHNNLGMIYVKQKKWQNALDEFSKAIQCGNQSVSFVNRARVRVMMDDRDGAISDYRKAISLMESGRSAQTVPGGENLDVVRHELKLAQSSTK